MAQQERALPTADLIPGTYVVEGELMPEIFRVYFLWYAHTTCRHNAGLHGTQNQ